MMDIEKIHSEAEFLAPKLKASIMESLKGHHASVSYDKNGMVIKIWGHNPNNGIAMNSPSYMMFIMYLVDGSGHMVDMDKLSIESIVYSNELKNAGVKYRRISSKHGVADVTEKFLKWINMHRMNIGGVESLRRH